MMFYEKNDAFKTEEKLLNLLRNPSLNEMEWKDFLEDNMPCSKGNFAFSQPRLPTTPLQSFLKLPTKDGNSDVCIQ